MARQTAGNRVLVVRERRDMSRTDLASRVGVAESKLARWERGEQEPRLDDIAALAKILGVEKLWLAFGERQPRPV